MYKFFYWGRIYLDYRWLPFRLAFLVVSLDYPWLSLVIAWLSHEELHWNRRKVPEEYICKCVGDICMSARFYSIKYICISRKRCFRGTLANFYKSKKWIFFNVDYRPGSKKSKFDMILIRHSPFKRYSWHFLLKLWV